MKRTFLFFAVMLTAVLSVQAQMTKEERKFAVDHLIKSQKEMMDLIKGMSEEQLNFKTDADSWSVSDCVRHMAIAEKNIWAGFVVAGLANDPDPSRRSEVKITDDMLMAGIESRDQKVKTSAPFEPGANPAPFKEVVKEFKGLRKEHIAYTKKTKDDLRNRYGQSPFDVIDLYQAIIFISGHTTRHTKQIKQVMAHADFPK